MQYAELEAARTARPRSKIYVGAALVALALVALQMLVHPPQSANQNAPAPNIAPVATFIERVDLDGQDVADLLDLNVWKFHYDAPAGGEGASFWIEDWRRNAKNPDIYGVGAIGWLDPQTRNEHKLLIKLPRGDEKEIAIDADGVKTRAQSPIVFDGLKKGGTYITKLLQNEPIALDKDVTLFTYAWNKNGAVSDSEGMEKRHDRTIYFKMRVQKDKRLTKPIWKNSGVVLTKN